ncbi:hypothetical protein [Leptolyngbya sp. 'hensonii']|uniref:hypothetical protein n=1 Tax=Leptolyngbya sp. 'hensonii' TaxID=1922337 RepID=UPI0015C5410C|nr:hypothetical protein [Leptolyngbya sp. 'hensonii']
MQTLDSPNSPTVSISHPPEQPSRSSAAAESPHPPGQTTQHPTEEPPQKSAIPVKQIYPNRVVNNFLAACTSGHEKALKKVCICALEGIQRQYSLQAFIQLDQAMKRGSRLPEDIFKIVETCKEPEKKSDKD